MAICSSKATFHICIYIQACLHTRAHTHTHSQSFRISPGLCFTIERDQCRRVVSYPELGSPTTPSFQNIVKGQELRESEPQRQNTTLDSQEDASGPCSQLLSLTLQVVLMILMLLCPAYMGLRSRKRRERKASRSKSTQSNRKWQLKAREDRKTWKTDKKNSTQWDI